jgi:hypothetical protein
MNQIHQFVVRLGSSIHGGLLVTSLVTLNVAWLIMLRALGTHFQSVADYPLLDLQNSLSSDTVMTPSRVLAQIATYTSEAKSVYWSFFILDNIMPPLTFGSFALLWVYLLRSNPNHLTQRMLQSYLLLVPLGVGAFDWIENLAYLSAIHAYPAPDVLPAIGIGLVAKWLKAACLMLTTWGIIPLVIYHVGRRLRQRWMHAEPGVVS